MQTHVVPRNRHHPAILCVEFIINVDVRESVNDIRRDNSALVARLFHDSTAPRQLGGREGQDDACWIIQPYKVIALVQKIVEGKTHLIRVRHRISRRIPCYEFRIPFCPAFFRPVGFDDTVILEIENFAIERIAFILNFLYHIHDIIAALLNVKYLRTDLQSFVDERDTFDSLRQACAIHNRFCLLYDFDAFLRNSLELFCFLSNFLGVLIFFLYPLAAACEISAHRDL